MSGIYIKGMEKPKACIFCELYDHENYWCNAAKKDVELCFDEKLCSFCPLIPVPDHGRLIDADAIQYIESSDWAVDDKVDRYTIADMPTIIEADKEGEA